LLERMAQESDLASRINATADARVAMIRNHAADECAKIARRIAYLEALIRLHLPGDAGSYKRLYGKKSVSLAHGTVGFRAHAASVEVTDKAKALAFAEKNGLEVKVERSVGKTALKEYIVRTGDE